MSNAALGLIATVGRFWLIDPAFATHAESLASGLSATDILKMQESFEAKVASDKASQGSDKPSRYRINDGNAVIEITGPMTKRPSCMAMMFGDGGASTLMTEMAIRDAIADPEVKDITLLIETPGGEVSGAFDLADTIFRANKKKPIYAYLSDQATSGGYLIASQASRVFANSNALVGSIGVYTTLVDRSKQLEQAGVKVHLVKAGEFKGVGVPGVPITKDNISTVQDRIDAFHTLFTKAIMRGRSMTKEEVGKVSDAQVFVGAQAIGVGLVDEIVSLDAALKMARSGTGRVKLRSIKMADSKTKVEEVAETDLGADVSLILDAQETSQAEQIADVATTDEKTKIELAPAKVALTPQIWVAVADHLGLSITGDNAQAKITEFIKHGQVYDETVRKAAIKMSVVAGYGDMSDFINGLPLEAALAHLKTAKTVATSKGLVNTDGGRKTAPQEVIGDPKSKSVVPADASAKTDNDNPEAADPIRSTIEQMRASGVYAGF